MTRRYMQITYTPDVLAAQAAEGTREVAARIAASPRDDQALTWQETAFLQAQDSFYLASVGQTGWPYVQFRGGPPGFLKVLDPQTLAYADFSGNKMYISTGNIRSDPRVSLFFMDYAHRRRLKVLARARVYPAAERPDLVAQVADPAYPARVERVVVFELEAFDWNCPQHITPRFTEAQIGARVARLEARIAELEASSEAPPAVGAQERGAPAPER